jgi:hypothetical protein
LRPGELDTHAQLGRSVIRLTSALETLKQERNGILHLTAILESKSQFELELACSWYELSCTP